MYQYNYKTQYVSEKNKNDGSVFLHSKACDLGYLTLAAWNVNKNKQTADFF